MSSEQQELTSDTKKQPDAPINCTPRKPSSLLTTVSLLLRLKDPTHRARGAWVQERAGRYSVQHSTADDPHHVLLVSKGSRYSAKLQGVLGSGGADGPTEVVSWRWGWSPVRFAYYVWVFKEGTFELLSDGGVINWCWESPQAERTGEKSVEFHKLV